MAPEDQDAPQNKGDEDWIDVGDGAPPPPAADTSAAGAEETGQEESHVYEGKTSTPPWKLSSYMGILGLVLMAVVFVFPEARRISAPWNPSFPTAYILLVLPALTFMWAAIGLLSAEFREDRGRAWSGLLLGVLTVALGFAVMVTDPARGTGGEVSVQDERLDMTGEELREWRIEKLNR